MCFTNQKSIFISFSEAKNGKYLKISFFLQPRELNWSILIGKSFLNNMHRPVLHHWQLHYYPNFPSHLDKFGVSTKREDSLTDNSSSGCAIIVIIYQNNLLEVLKRIVVFSFFLNGQLRTFSYIALTFYLHLLYEQEK